MWIEQGQLLAQRRGNAHRAPHVHSSWLSLAAWVDEQDDQGNRLQGDPVAGVEAGSGRVEEAILDDMSGKRRKLLRCAQSARIGEKLDLPGRGVTSSHVQDRRIEAARDDGVDADAATGKLARSG